MRSWEAVGCIACLSCEFAASQGGSGPPCPNADTGLLVQLIEAVSWVGASTACGSMSNVFQNLHGRRVPSASALDNHGHKLHSLASTSFSSLQVGLLVVGICRGSRSPWLTSLNQGLLPLWCGCSKVKRSRSPNQRRKVNISWSPAGVAGVMRRLCQQQTRSLPLRAEPPLFQPIRKSDLAGRGAVGSSHHLQRTSLHGSFARPRSHRNGGAKHPRLHPECPNERVVLQQKWQVPCAPGQPVWLPRRPAHPSSPLTVKWLDPQW